MMARCAYFILISFVLVLRGAGAEEVDRPPVDPQPLPAIDLRKPAEQVEPPAANFEAVQSMRTRAEKREAKFQLAVIARNEQALRKVRAAFDAMNRATLTIYKIRETGESPKNISAEKFRHYEVLARCEADANLGQEWSTLMSNLQTTGTNAMSCFEPGIGLQWKDSDGHQLEALVCLECLLIHWFIDADESISFVPGKPDIFAIGEQFLKLFPDEDFAKYLASRRARWDADMKKQDEKEARK